MGKSCLHNKSLRRAADVVERIAGYKCQSWLCAGRQNANVLRTYNLQVIDNVDLPAVCFFDFNLIAHLYVLQAPKKAIAMTRKTNIPIMTEASRACDMTNSTV